MFLTSPSKYLSILKKEIGQKLLSYNCRSTDWSAKYEIAEDSKSWDTYVLLIYIVWETSISLITVTVLAKSFTPFFKDT